ncbi:MAG: M20 family metallopeptidase, partial [Bacillales bacterium]
MAKAVLITIAACSQDGRATKRKDEPMPILNRAAEMHDEITAWRRHLHQNPELLFDVHETAAFVAQKLKEFGCDEVVTGLGRTGVVGLVRGRRGDGPTIGLRADMDALPIAEQNDVVYKSTVPGKMHACGHDAHMAILLGAARLLNGQKSHLSGNVKLIFQPAEETVGGAKPMIAAGVLDSPKVDAAFGLHVAPEIPVGQIGWRYGQMNAASDTILITVKGNKAHGASPHTGTDAVVIAAHVITALQTIVSRKISPVDTGVVTVGRFQAGTGFNIIANEAVLEGTIRYFKNAVKKKMKEELYRIVKGVCLANDATYKIDYTDGYPPVINHKDEAELIFEAAKIVPGVNSVLEAPLQMGAEDFSYYLHDKPGAFFFTGAGKEGKNHPHHHP